MHSNIHKNPPCILAIGGSDSSGGAGIAADVQAITELGQPHGLRPAIAITHVTAQHDQQFYGSEAVPSNILHQQLQAVTGGMDIKAIKIGMLGNAETVNIVADWLATLPAKIPLVVDPVILSSSGAPLLDEKGIQCMQQRLFPKATLITPNIPEAEQLTHQNITSLETMLSAAQSLLSTGAQAILLKGGHAPTPGTLFDLLAESWVFNYFKTRYYPGVIVRGSGCRLASAIATCLGSELPLKKALEHSRCYIATLFEQQAIHVP